VERAIFDGWRFLGADAPTVLSYTPREFTIMLRAQQERQFDAYEREATYAIWYEKAHRDKRPKPSDLFSRKKAKTQEKVNLAELKEHFREKQALLDRIRFTK